MKTKSKLVLGLSILSAATIAAGATSTFAWYQVAAAANSVSGNIASGNLVTGQPSAGTIDLAVTASLTPVNANSTAILAQLDGGSWVTKAYNSTTNSYITVTPGTNQVYSKAYAVKISIADERVPTGMTKADAAKLIFNAGVKFAINVEAKLADTTTDNPLADRTVVWASTSELADNAQPAATPVLEVNGTIGSTWEGAEITIGYVAFYVKGQTSAGADTDDGVVDGQHPAKNTHFKVTVSKQN